MKYDEGEGAGYWFVHTSGHNNGLPCARIHDQLKVSFRILAKSQKEFVEDIFELVHWTGHPHLHLAISEIYFSNLMTAFRSLNSTNLPHSGLSGESGCRHTRW